MPVKREYDPSEWQLLIPVSSTTSSQSTFRSKVVTLEYDLPKPFSVRIPDVLLGQAERKDI